MTTPPTAPRGVISAHEVYTLAEFRRRLGWGAHALRQARAAGLRFVTIGREKYIRGEEFARWVKSMEDLQ